LEFLRLRLARFLAWLKRLDGGEAVAGVTTGFAVGVPIVVSVCRCIGVGSVGSKAHRDSGGYLDVILAPAARATHFERIAHGVISLFLWLQVSSAMKPD
jgi:hypothetical protein